MIPTARASLIRRFFFKGKQVGPQVRASNEGLLRPRVARAGGRLGYPALAFSASLLEVDPELSIGPILIFAGAQVLLTLPSMKKRVQMISNSLPMCLVVLFVFE